MLGPGRPLWTEVWTLPGGDRAPRAATWLAVRASSPRDPAWYRRMSLIPPRTSADFNACDLVFERDLLAALGAHEADSLRSRRSLSEIKGPSPDGSRRARRERREFVARVGRACSSKVQEVESRFLPRRCPEARAGGRAGASRRGTLTRRSSDSPRSFHADATSGTSLRGSCLPRCGACDDPCPDSFESP